MRSRIGKAVRKEFPARFKKALPQFQKLPLAIQKGYDL
jgi:hypothetical protein